VPRCAGIGDYIRRADPATTAHLEWARLSTGSSGGHTVRRPYHFNSVGGFSQINDFDDDEGDSYMIRPDVVGAPYMVVLDVSPRGRDRALKDANGEVLRGGPAGHMIGDPFNPAFLEDLDDIAERQVKPRRDDPNLQMWFAGNEIGMFDKAQRGVSGVRDFRRWLWSDVPPGSTLDNPLCARHALGAYLRERAVEGLELGGVVRHDAHEDIQRFVRERFLPEWVRAVTTRLRAADPNHLIASPRMAIATPSGYRFWQPDDCWCEAPGETIGELSPFHLLKAFDLVAINCYSGGATFKRPWFTEGVHKIQRESGLPIIISEFGIRTRIDGWSNRGGAGSFAPDQRERGRRYRSQLEQFISFRHVVGASWHAWSDRYVPTDEGLQINMGLVQCEDPRRGMNAGRRWAPVDELVAETNRSIYDRIEAKTGF
jgi:hypothetical protein